MEISRQEILEWVSIPFFRVWFSTHPSVTSVVMNKHPPFVSHGRVVFVQKFSVLLGCYLLDPLTKKSQLSLGGVLPAPTGVSRLLASPAQSEIQGVKKEPGDLTAALFLGSWGPHPVFFFFSTFQNLLMFHI